VAANERKPFAHLVARPSRKRMVFDQRDRFGDFAEYLSAVCRPAIRLYRFLIPSGLYIINDTSTQ
jgi:hypothetical protein